MTFTREVFLRSGATSLSVFRGKTDRSVFFSVDRHEGSRRIKGPLFPEEDLYVLAELIHDYDESESGAVHGSALKRLDGKSMGTCTGQKQPDAMKEVSIAIAQAGRTKTESVPRTRRKKGWSSKIEVQKTMPEWRYAHTCIRCGSHVVSYLRMEGGVNIALCPNCTQVHAVRS